MDSDHKLTGCVNRATFQFKRAVDFLDAVSTVIPSDDGDSRRQFLYHSMILMLQSYFEEYLRCVISIGTFWKTPTVRAHLGERHQRADEFASMPGPLVARYAQQTVSFDERGARLKALLTVLIGDSPFPDEDTEDKCLDFVAVRNLIVHSGGWPSQANVPTVKSSNVIVENGKVGDTTFYRLSINREFFVESLTALTRCIQHIEKCVSEDPAFRL